MTEGASMFELVRAPCVLTEMHQKAAARGDEFENLLVIVVRLTTEGMRAAERLLPGIQAMAIAIAADEGHRGVVLKSSTEMPYQSVKLYPRKPFDGAPVAAWMAAEVKGAPVVKIDREGEGTLHLKLVVKSSREQMSSLTEWLKADMAVSLVPSQVTVQDAIAAAARANQEPAPEQAGLFGDEDEPDEDDGPYVEPFAVEAEPIEPFDPDSEVRRAVERLKRATLGAGARMTVSVGGGEAVVIEPAEVEHPERPKRRRGDRLGVPS
jgi:hypothetical protein